MSTWTPLTFAYGSKLTAGKMQSLFDNFSGFADKDGAAPVLKDGYITVPMFKSAEFSNTGVSVAGNTTVYENIQVNAGTYAAYLFSVYISSGQTSLQYGLCIRYSGGSFYDAIWLKNVTATSCTINWRAIEVAET